MSHVLQDCEPFAIVYMDDVLIFSRTRADHLTHIEAVLKKLLSSATQSQRCQV